MPRHAYVDSIAALTAAKPPAIGVDAEISMFVLIVAAACVKMQRQVTRGEWKFGFRAGRRDDADEHAVELGEQLRRHLDGAGRPVAVRDQHLDRVRIFVRAAAGLEVVRGAGYIPDDLEAPDRWRDEAPARQLPPAWSTA